MLTKSKVISELNNLPDKFSIDDLIERLILVEKVDKGLKQIETGDVVSEAELDYEIKKWFE